MPMSHMLDFMNMAKKNESNELANVFVDCENILEIYSILCIISMAEKYV